MSSHVFVKVKMRAVDARRFVREFEREYGDQIEVEGQRVGRAARKAAAARGVQAVGWYAQRARRPLSQ